MNHYAGIHLSLEARARELSMAGGIILREAKMAGEPEAPIAGFGSPTLSWPAPR